LPRSCRRLPDVPVVVPFPCFSIGKIR
jgi:hypothetical protein